MNGELKRSDGDPEGTRNRAVDSRPAKSPLGRPLVPASPAVSHNGQLPFPWDQKRACSLRAAANGQQRSPGGLRGSERP